MGELVVADVNRHFIPYRPGDVSRFGIRVSAAATEFGSADVSRLEISIWAGDSHSSSPIRVVRAYRWEVCGNSISHIRNKL